MGIRRFMFRGVTKERDGMRPRLRRLNLRWLRARA